MNPVRRPFDIAVDACRRFNDDDGWAIASHIALSTLMALFPFLIVVTALAAIFFGSQDLADEAARILLEAWPKAVAAPISQDIAGVLMGSKREVLTFGLLFAVYFASSGVESLRIGLNRAYGVTEPRPWWLLRIESVGYVLLSAVSLLVFAFLVVLAPSFIIRAIVKFPALGEFGHIFDLARYLVTAVVLVGALVILHKWLPAGRRRVADILPGIAATLALWLVSGEIFGRYLARFAGGYVSMYAGLASVMIALVFLYICASIFIFGGELNTAVRHADARRRDGKSAARADGDQPPAASSTSS